MEILKYVDQLEEIVDTATKVPLTGKVMVDVDEVFELIDLIRESASGIERCPVCITGKR